MANEITVSASLKCTKGNFDLTRSKSGATYDQAGTHSNYLVQDVATTAAGVALTITSDVATGGWAWFRNMDAANYIEIGIQQGGVFYPFVKLKAGEFALLPLSITAVYARANTATVRLEHWINER